MVYVKTCSSARYLAIRNRFALARSSHCVRTVFAHLIRTVVALCSHPIHTLFTQRSQYSHTIRTSSHTIRARLARVHRFFACIRARFARNSHTFRAPFAHDSRHHSRIILSRSLSVRTIHKIFAPLSHGNRTLFAPVRNLFATCSHPFTRLMQARSHSSTRIHTRSQMFGCVNVR